MQQIHTPQSVEAVCDAVGRKAIADACQVTAAAVSNWVAEGKFPSKCFKVVTVLCEIRGIDCPDTLFNFLETKAS